MKTRFGVARCCCGGFCEDCCNGNIPSEWDVDIEFTDAVCDVCDEFQSGTFTLSRNSSLCEWLYDDTPIFPPYSVETCAPSYIPYQNDSIIGRRVELRVQCVSETQYRVSVLFYTGRTYGSSVEKTISYGVDTLVASFLGVYNDIVEYSTLVDYDDFICDEAVEYELPFASLSMYRRFFVRSDVPLQPDLLQEFQFRKTTLPIGEFYSASAGWYLRAICEPPATIKITGVP